MKKYTKVLCLILAFVMACSGMIVSFAEQTEQSSVSVADANENQTYAPGDVIQDGEINILDIIGILDIISGIGTYTTAQITAANFDDSDDTVNISDVAKLFLFVHENNVVAEKGSVEVASDGVNNFIYNIPSSKTSFKVLQLADTQITDLNSTRTSTQVNPTNTRYLEVRGAFYSSDPNKAFSTSRDLRVYDYIRDLVSQTKPDMIVIVGDVVYGEMDDDGHILKEIIGVMDSFKLPWSMVFGNHDNESQKGVTWQVQQLKASKYCIFDDGGLTHGHSNFDILFKQNDQSKFCFFMVDTNGCDTKRNLGIDGIMPTNPDYSKITQTAGIYEDQRTWYSSVGTANNAAAGKTIPSLCYLHIPPKNMRTVMRNHYSPKTSNITAGGSSYPNEFGYDRSESGGFSGDADFVTAAKAVGTKGFFFGHLHENSASAVDGDGVRFTYVMKTGTDALTISTQTDTVIPNTGSPTPLGGTLTTIDIATGAFTVKHCPIERKTPIQ